MTDFYFGLKLTVGAIVFVFLGIVLIVLLIKCIINSHREQNIKKYMESIGFSRYLHDVSSCGNGSAYGYKRPATNERILESELFNMKLNDVKKRFYKI